MRTVVVPKNSRAINALLEEARNEDVLLQAQDGTRFVLSAVDDFGEEIEAQRRNKKLMKFLDERGKETDCVSLEEVDRQLGLGTAADRKDNRPPNRKR
ncbi:MAG TPA: hypothetical protein VEL76_07295 [Gemmataceae bacterium]|nr:hypothetical protein [Gemmataceae bacterium]